MAVKLELRHLQGAPKTWLFEDRDEQSIRGLFRGLDEFSANPKMRSAVIVATDDNGSVIGAWNRAGALRLGQTIAAVPPSADPAWIEMYGVLDIAATGP